VAQTEDTPVKVAEPEDNDTDAAREKSLQLGGGVPAGRVFGKYLTFLGEVRDELRKVTWPTRKTVIVETIVVIVITFFFTALIVGVDNVFATIFNWLLFGKQLPWQL
jgi:preprotein translocase subunit SecE